MIIEVSKRVFCGDDDAYNYGWKKKDDWAFIHCAKEPFHREFVGYSGRGCPKDDPEYLYAIRDREIALNLVDVNNPDFFNISMIKVAMGFALTHDDKNLLFHCNLGQSRSPSLAMLYLAITDKIPRDDFLLAERAFKRLYSPYNPMDGIRSHLRMNWEEYTA